MGGAVGDGAQAVAVGVVGEVLRLICGGAGEARETREPAVGIVAEALAPGCRWGDIVDARIGYWCLTLFHLFHFLSLVNNRIDRL